MRKLRYLLLALFLLGGQSALLAHVIEHLDQDHPDHACELCLHSAGLESGMAATVAPYVVPVLAEAPLPEYHLTASFIVERLFDARGPPAIFSV